MQFEFLPLRFEFTARDAIVFASGKAGNILRGALGTIFKRMVCVPECRDSSTCERGRACPYARVFEPVSAGEGPSGFADSPRPFVFRARHLDGLTIEPGEAFSFDLNVFTLEPEVTANFVRTFGALASEGLGPGRGKADLERVRRIAVGELQEQTVGDGTVRPVALRLDPLPGAPSKIHVNFLSPTELKHEQRMVERPEFPILFARIRDRIGMLRKLYGPGALEIDFQGMGMRAAAIRMTGCEVHRVEIHRRSSRTGQTHSLGGFVGSAEYEGDLAEFLPYLEAGRWTGVGRQSVWGKGEFSIE